MMAIPTITMAAPTQSTVNLGTTATFAVLAGSVITNTGTTTIGGSVGGNIGVSPGSAVTGFPPGIVSDGTIHSDDAPSSLAKDDLVTAYNDAAGRTPTVDLTGQDLGGLTLTTGVYHFSSSAQLTGTLTLDAQGDPEAVFIFQIGTTLTTASNSSVSLINGARFCRTFWQVGSSATLGTTTHFVGHIFAMQSITLNTGATMQGQLLARNGAVTLDSNTITNGICDISTTSTPVSTSTATATSTSTATPMSTSTNAPTSTSTPKPTSTPMISVSTFDTGTGALIGVALFAIVAAGLAAVIKKKRLTNRL